MTVSFTDLGSSTLNGGITSTATSLIIQTADVGKFPASGDYYLSVDVGSNVELMHVTGGQGTATLTVTRGAGTPATAPVSHLSGVAVTEVVTATTLASFLQSGAAAGGDLAGTYPNPTVSQQTSRLPVKASVRVAATANVTVSSPGTAVDSVTLSNGDRVLLTAQTTGSENGVYVFNGSASAMTRDTDASAAAQFVSGFQVYVREGTANAAKTYVHTTAAAITLGTTALTFVALGTGSGGSSTLAGDTDVSIASPANFDQLQYQTADSKWHNVKGGAVRLGQTKLTASAASIILSSIPGGYSGLRLSFAGRSDYTGTFESLLGRFNGDTAANYDTAEMHTGSTGSSALGATSINLGWVSGNGADANLAAASDIMLHDYADTSWFKVATATSFRSQTGQIMAATLGGVWRSTSAIASITLFPQNGSNWLSNTVVTLWGLV